MSNVRVSLKEKLNSSDNKYICS